MLNQKKKKKKVCNGTQNKRKIKDLLRHTDDSFSYSNCMYISIYTHLKSWKAAAVNLYERMTEWDSNRWEKKELCGRDQITRQFTAACKLMQKP